jgi:Pex2 / Pex12 amino terminal region
MMNHDTEVPRLVTEEWMMDPSTRRNGSSTIIERNDYGPSESAPSFLETVFLCDTERQITDVLRTCMDRMIRDRFIRPVLRQLQQQQQQQQQHDTTDDGGSAVRVGSNSSSKSNHMHYHKHWEQLRQQYWLFMITQQKWKRWLRREIVRISILILTRMEQLLNQYGPEIRCLLRYVLERQCLLRNGSRSSSTLTEWLYGMIRVKAIRTPQPLAQRISSSTTDDDVNDGNNNNDSTVAGTTKEQKMFTKLVPLQKGDQIRLAILQAILPYLEERFPPPLYNNSIVTQQPNNHDNSTLLRPRNEERNRGWWSLRWGRILDHHRTIPSIISMIQAIWYGTDTCCQWRYLLGLSHYTNVRNWMLCHVVQRISSPQDPRTTATRTAENVAAVKNSTDPERSVDGSTTIQTSYMSKLLYIVAASVLSLSWVTHVVHWYQERCRAIIMQQEQERQMNMEQLDSNESNSWQQQQQLPRNVLPVPLLPKETTTFNILQEQQPTITKGCCLLCGQILVLVAQDGPSRVPTALNGYIYCYTCIARYIRQHGTCPMTQNPILNESKQLIRLFFEMKA